MFDCVCLLEVLELSFSSLNPLPWANGVSVMNFLSSQTRGASRKERRNRVNEMGNVTKEIDFGERFLFGNIRPLEAPKPTDLVFAFSKMLASLLP